MNIKLGNKTVVVTGGGSGIGAAISILLVSEQGKNPALLVQNFSTQKNSNWI